MVMSWRRHGDGIEPNCGEHIKGGKILRGNTYLVAAE